MASAPGITGEKIWLDGQMLDWDQARVHILTHTLHYGLGVFEGIRCYAGADGRSAVFRLPEHIKRLFDSAKINLIEIPYTPAELEEAMEHIRRGIKLARDHEKPYLFLGRIHKATGDVEAAEKLYTRAVQIQPDCVEALRELRLINMRRHKEKGFIGRLLRR